MSNYTQVEDALLGTNLPAEDTVAGGIGAVSADIRIAVECLEKGDVGDALRWARRAGCHVDQLWEARKREVKSVLAAAKL